MSVREKLAVKTERLSKEIRLALPQSRERDQAIRKLDDAAEDLRGAKEK